MWPTINPALHDGVEQELERAERFTAPPDQQAYGFFVQALDVQHNVLLLFTFRPFRRGLLHADVAFDAQVLQQSFQYTPSFIDCLLWIGWSTCAPRCCRRSGCGLRI